jgi:hypothetical protein
MKLRIVLPVLLLALFLSCSSLGDGIYKDFDQFSQKNTVSGVVRLKQKQGFDIFKIVFTYNDVNSDQEVGAYLYTETTTWYYFHRIGFKIDEGEPEYRVHLKAMRNVLPNQKANENVYFEISLAELEAMANAEDVFFLFEGEKFSVTSSMTKRNIRTLKKFLAEIDLVRNKLQ